ncbi:MAG: metallophosphoesterase [Planctomycetota bacterium]
MALMTRRRFLWSSVALGVGAAGAAGYAVGIEPCWERVERRTLKLRGLPSAWSGRRLVQLSDLHAGPRVSGAYLRDAIGKLPALGPDVVAVTGDWVTMHDALPDAALDDMLAALSAATIERGVPVVACLGNHDYGSTWRDQALADALTDRLASAGVQVLRNQAVAIDGLVFAGVGDLWSDEFRATRAIDAAKALEAYEEGRDLVVLCHNPDSLRQPDFDEGRWSGVVLGGHTHGGQCKFPLLGRPMLPVRHREYAAGWFDLSSTRKLYVNVGLGHSHRVRFGVRPEVTVFELAGAS